MISFDLPSTQHVVEALRGRIEHYLFCSSIWVYGRLSAIPSTEADPPNPIDAYGKGKAESEAWLMREARVAGFPATCFRPGHIVGEGWNPINPAGNANPDTFSLIARGDELALPNLGLETVHHVHADDVAQWIIRAIETRSASVGEVFNTVSEQAVTLRGYAEAAYRWFGKAPRIAFKPFDEWILGLGDDAEGSRGHVIRSSCHSIEKSRRHLGYRPRYTSLEAVKESVRALIASGKSSLRTPTCSALTLRPRQLSWRMTCACPMHNACIERSRLNHCYRTLSPDRRRRPRLPPCRTPPPPLEGDP